LLAARATLACLLGQQAGQRRASERAARARARDVRARGAR
jgi:hypothetical protein